MMMTIPNLTLLIQNLTTSPSNVPPNVNIKHDQHVNPTPTLLTAEFHNHTSPRDKTFSNALDGMIPTDNTLSTNQSISIREITTVAFILKLQTPINGLQLDSELKRTLTHERDEKLERHLLLTVLMISSYAFAVISALVVVMCRERRSRSERTFEGVSHYYSSVFNKLNQLTSSVNDRKHMKPLRRSLSDTCLLRAEYNSCHLEYIC